MEQHSGDGVQDLLHSPLSVVHEHYEIILVLCRREQLRCVPHCRAFGEPWLGDTCLSQPGLEVPPVFKVWDTIHFVMEVSNKTGHRAYWGTTGSARPRFHLVNGYVVDDLSNKPYTMRLCGNLLSDERENRGGIEPGARSLVDDYVAWPQKAIGSRSLVDLRQAKMVVVYNYQAGLIRPESDRTLFREARDMRKVSIIYGFDNMGLLNSVTTTEDSILEI